MRRNALELPESEGKPYESCAGSGDGVSSRKEKTKMLPRVVLDETLMDTKMVVKKTRAGPKSSKKETNTFGNVKPNATSPPPTVGMEVTTEEEDKQESFSRPPSTMGASDAANADVANMDDVCSDGYSADSAVSTVSHKSTASGTAKRSKTTHTKTPKKVRKSEESQGGAASSDEEKNNPTEQEVRKRGRPVTTGEGIEIIARKTVAKKLKALNQEVENVEKILQGGYDPSDYRGGRWAAKREKMEEEMQNLPSRDIAAQMLDATKQVEMVANKSGSLKGTYVKLLKDTMLRMTSGVDALINRAHPKESDNAREVERLREEIRSLREEMERLRAQRDQDLMPPPPPQHDIGRKQPLEERMEVEVEGREGTAPPSRTHPSKEEWPAIRPAIQGIRKILSDGEEKGSPTSSKTRMTRTSRGGSSLDLVPPKNLEITGTDVRKILDEKFKKLSLQISSQIRDEVGRLLPTILGGAPSPHPSEKVPDRAQKNVLNTSTPRRDAEERPVPARKGKGGKGKKGKEVEVAILKRDVPPKEDRSRDISKEESKSESLAGPRRGTEETWTKVIGRRAANKDRTGKVSIPERESTVGGGQM